jgi:RNA-directed DNA polymerase
VGGVVSPLLSNIFLHYVLDEWFAETVQPRLKGRSSLVRFCDDFVMVFEYSDDIRRVEAVLGKRLERFGLQLHPEKSRLVDFRIHRPEGPGWPSGLPVTFTFNFLGFIHFWGKSRKGNWVLRQLMAKERIARALEGIRKRCWQMMHWPLSVQHERLCRQFRGYLAYFGITDNCQRLQRLRHLAERTWREALARRTREPRLGWVAFARILRRFPLPRVKIVHSYTRA